MVDSLNLRARYVIYPTLKGIVSSAELLKEGRLSKKEKLQLSRKIGDVIRELCREIVTLRHEPMTANDIAEELLNIRNDILSSTGYLGVINMIIDDETTPQQFIRDLLRVRRYGREKIEKTILRILSRDDILFQKDDGLFWSRSWTSKEVFQIYVQLASRYRTKDDKKKEFYKNEAVLLLESGAVDFPDKEGLIQTLRRI